MMTTHRIFKHSSRNNNNNNTTQRQLYGDCIKSSPEASTHTALEPNADIRKYYIGILSAGGHPEGVYRRNRRK
jgi:hypothetical protein